MSIPRNLGITTLLTLGLAAGPGRAAEIDRYVPADATAVVSLNVRQLLDAPLVRDHAPAMLQAVLRQNPGLRQLLVAAGLDPLRDVERIVLAMSGTRSEQALLIVHGKFDVGRARQAAGEFARQHPGQLVIHDEGGAVLYENRSASRPYHAAFADEGTAVAALSRDAVAAAVRGGKEPARLRPALQALVSRADGNRGAWLAALAPPELGKQLARDESTADLAGRITGFTAALDVDRDVQAEFQIHTTDAKTADRVAELLDGARGLARLLAQNQPGVGDLLTEAVDNLKVGVRKSTVELRLRVAGDTLETALRKAPGQGKGP
jgi:hypothetical protein